MKRTFSINLSGQVFQIEDAAYEKLKKYLDEVANYFNNEKDGYYKRTVVENRVAKLLNERTTTQGLVDESMIDEVIAAMGAPEHIDMSTEPRSNNNYSEENRFQRPPYEDKKRLYRDPHSKIFGGVCSGLAYYFSMDRLLVRILFFILFLLTSGVALLAYIILWIAAPAAKTPGQRAEMEATSPKKSESVNKNESRDNEPKYDKVSDQPRYGRHQNYDGGSENVIAKIFGAIFLIFGFLLLAGLIAGTVFATKFIGVLPGFHDGFFINHLYTENLASTLLICLLVIFGIPVLLIIYAGTRLLFNYVTSSRSVIFTALGAWIIAIIIAIGTSKGAVDVFTDDATVRSQQLLENYGDTLYIKIDEDQYLKYSYYKAEVNNYRIAEVDGKELLISRPIFSIEETDNETTRLKIKKTSKGKNDRMAQTNADKISHNQILNGNTLLLDPYFAIGGEGKWRNQRAEITLELPQGKVIFLDESLLPVLRNIENISNIWEADMLGFYWKMESNRLVKCE